MKANSRLKRPGLQISTAVLVDSELCREAQPTLLGQNALAGGAAGSNDGSCLNIANARTRGLEVESAYRPHAKGRIGFALGLLDTRIDDFCSGAKQTNVNEPRTFGVNLRADF